MQNKVSHKKFLLLALLTIPLALALSACAGADGKDGTNGTDGQDLTEPSAKLTGTFLADVLPLFTQNDVYFDGALACTACHFAVSAVSLHELNMGSYAGILTGADALTNPPPNSEDLLGRTGTCVGSTDVTACPPTWSSSGMRKRLRNTRMPPGWPFDLGEGNRDTHEINAIRAWVTDGAQQTGCTGTAVCYDTLLSALAYNGTSPTDLDVGGSGSDPTFRIETLTVGQLFTTDDAFFPGSQACDQCHGDPTGGAFSWHELDMGSYAGILAGADGGTADLLGRGSDCTDFASVTGTCAPDWSASDMRKRLRNTRMPPAWPFDLAESNRDMWAIQTVKAWVDAGAPNGAF